MKSRIIFAEILTGIALAVSCCASELRRPNIVFIHVDDMDFDEIGCYDGGGKVLTPNMDSLARDGMKFNRAYVVSSVCVPSRYSTLTGKYPGHNNLLNATVPADKTLSFENEDWSPRSGTYIEEGYGEKTFAHYLSELGYRTCMVGKYHNDRKSITRPYLNFGEDPFDLEVDRKVKAHYRETVERVKRQTGFDVVDRLYWENKEAFPVKALQFDNSPWVTEGAVEFIRESKGQPFFLYYANPLPHGDPVNDWWRTHYNPEVKVNMEDRDARATPAGMLDKAPDSQPSREEVIERCRKAGTWGKSSTVMTWLDDSIGVLLRTLEEEGVANNTLIILLSDHQSDGKRTLYEDGVQVPMIVKWPGRIAAGSVNDQLVANIDILPLIVRAGGGDPSALAEVDGVDFSPLLTAPEQPVRDHILLEVGFARGIVTDQYKYFAVRFPDYVHETLESSDNVIWDGSTTRSTQTWFKRFFPNYSDLNQLYDLRKDPKERDNLFSNPEHAAALKKMKRTLEENLTAFNHEFGEFTEQQCRE